MRSSTMVVIPAADGYPLSARFLVAQAPLRGAALIVPAMGVTQEFYAEFASWLADRGWAVVTFDFRGTGASAPRTLRGFEADILSWAQLDCAAVLAYARKHAEGRPLLWIGHSLGGQILAMTPGNDSIAAAITVASGVGYWRENAYPLRRYSWWLWHVIAPVATALCGYFPGRRLHIVGDLPKGVIEQWSRWCRHPEYAVGVEGEPMRDLYRNLTLPLLSVSFTDDGYMSASNIAVLHGFYENADCDMRRFSPADFDVARIGHFGFFRADGRARLWQVTLNWAEAAIRRPAI